MKQEKPIQPPAWAQSVLRWYCRREMVEDLDGDLHEYFVRNCETKGVWKARLIYFLDVLKFMRAYTLKHPTQVNGSSWILYHNYYTTGIRNLKKYALNTFLNVTGLTIGLAGFFIILLYVQFEHNYNTHDPNAGRIFRVTLDVKSPASHETLKLGFTDAPLVDNLRESFPEIESVTGIFNDIRKRKVTHKGHTFLEENFYNTDTSYFRVFNHEWIEGNSASALSAPHQIVLTSRTRKKYFGDERALQQTLLINGQEHTVSGVIADQPDNTDLKFDALISGAPSDWTFTYILFRSAAHASQFESRLDSLLSENVSPALDDIGYEADYILESIVTSHFGEERYFDPPKGSRPMLIVFTGVAFLILTISLINFVNLSISQSAKRQGEIGVRKIFGAMRGHLRMQFLAEAFLICAFALGLSLIAVVYIAPLCFQDFGQVVASNFDDVASFVWIGIAALFVAVVTGSYPALHFARFSPVDNLKNSATFGHSINFRRGLVFIQFSGSIGLICAASVVHDQMDVVMNSDPGFSREHVAVIEIPPDQTTNSLIPSLKNSIDALPFVKSSSLVGENSTPGADCYWDTYFVKPEKTDPMVKMLSYARVDENYFDVLGISLLNGRRFTESDHHSDEDHVIVNEAMVQQMGWHEPLGKSIGYGWGGPGVSRPATVIGVVKDFNFNGLHKKVGPMQFYLNYKQADKMLVRLSETSFKTLQGLEDTWKKILGSQPFEFHLLDDDFVAKLERENSMQGLVTGFSAMATLIAALGLFGLVSITINQRMKETCLRKIFGADTVRILALTWKEYIAMILFASVIIFPVIHLIMSQWIENFPVQTEIGFSNVLIAIAVFSAVMVFTFVYHVIALRKVNVLKSIKAE